MKNSEIIGADKTVRPAPNTVLDVTCGNRGMWFDKHDTRTLFLDKRQEVIVQHTASGLRKNGKPYAPWVLNITPDVQCDFTLLPFESDSFYCVVFDPPHLESSPGAFMVKQYGTLYKTDWKTILSKGFSECFRVLKPNGILIFKWNEHHIKVSEILKLTEEKPLFGHKSGIRAKTHWITFMKKESPVVGEESAQENKENFHTSPNSASHAILPHCNNAGRCYHKTDRLDCNAEHPCYYQAKQQA